MGRTRVLLYGALLKRNIINTKGFTIVEISVSMLILSILLVTVFSMFGSLRGIDTLGQRIDVNEAGKMFLFRINNELIHAKKVINPKSWWNGSYQVKEMSFLDRAFKQINYKIQNSKVYRWLGNESFLAQKSKAIVDNVDDTQGKSYFHLTGRQKLEICLSLKRQKFKSREKVKHITLKSIVFLRGLMENQ